MNYKHFVIIFIILLATLSFGAWQYLQILKVTDVVAVDVGTPNPGHSWSQMECNADTLCIDTINKKIGIGTNSPTKTLSVVGNIGASGDICLNSGICLSQMTVSGVCGSSNGATLFSAPTTNLCNIGIASAVSDTGPWTWTCNGNNGGNNASCLTYYGNGVCGSSNGANLISIPTTNLCKSGTASAVSGTGPWTWTCSGSSGGTTASCSANLYAFAASDTVKYSDAGQFNTNSSSFVTAKSYTMPTLSIAAGSIRIKFKAWGDASGGRATYWQILKNGAAVWSNCTKGYSSSGGAWPGHCETTGSDVSYDLSGVSPGDTIVLQVRMSDGYTINSHISNFTIGFTP